MASQFDSALSALPDPCLLAVLQHVADDQRSLCSAARAHSRLHQAAVEFVNSITVKLLHEELLQGVLGYVSKHGQHINSINLSGRNAVLGRDPTLDMSQLAPALQLSSLQLEDLNVKLQPGAGWQGVLGSAAATGAPPALKQLQLHDCRLVDDEDGLAVLLAQLPGLEDLCIDSLWTYSRGGAGHGGFAATMLEGLPQLTRLELAGVRVQGPERAPSLQPLQALTLLLDLRLSFEHCRVHAGVLSGACNLTRLVVDSAYVDPEGMDGLTQLQHLHLSSCALRSLHEGGVALMLSLLQQLQQLTHLHLPDTLQDPWDGGAPAAAYSALTASSKLQHVDIREAWVADGVWQHMFPAGRQLPNLQELNVARTGDFFLPAPEGSRLVSCCPGLQCLDVQGLQDCAALLGPLQGLSKLHTLHLAADAATSTTGLKALCRLKGLKELTVPALLDGQLLPLSQLQQLTLLSVDRYRRRDHRLSSKVGLFAVCRASWLVYVCLPQQTAPLCPVMSCLNIQIFCLCMLIAVILHCLLWHTKEQPDVRHYRWVVERTVLGVATVAP
jgi:hypothetical protein